MTTSKSDPDLQTIGDGAVDVTARVATDVAINFAVDQAEEAAARHTGFGIVWNLLKLPFILSILAICLIATVHLFLSDNLVGGAVAGFITVVFGFGAKQSVLTMWSKLKKLFGYSKSED